MIHKNFKFLEMWARETERRKRECTSLNALKSGSGD